MSDRQSLAAQGKALLSENLSAVDKANNNNHDDENGPIFSEGRQSQVKILKVLGPEHELLPPKASKLLAVKKESSSSKHGGGNHTNKGG
jgi:hypothetical protein